MIGNACFWNVLSGNGGSGIEIQGANAKFNAVYGNYIGVDNTGTTALMNSAEGVMLDQGASNNIIGGAGALTFPVNVISGNGQYGVYLDTVNSNQVLGNFIGLGSDGSTVVANGRSGVRLINSGTNNQIGAANDGNVISGNTQYGVVLSGGPTLSGNSVVGNLIGTDKTGTVKKPNLQDGIFLNAPSNTIGGVQAGAANVISGNGNNGIIITGPNATANTVSVNLIGTDVTGTLPLGNHNDGVFIGAGSSNDTIGSAGAATPTIISGNGNAGVEIEGSIQDQVRSTSNAVVNCFIGTDITGKAAAIPNESYGVEINGSNSNTIGGTAAGTRNVISGNGNTTLGNRDFGVAIIANATGNNILGNLIGVGSDSTTAMGNGSDGVYVEVGSNSNWIGGPQAGAGNVICDNGTEYMKGAAWGYGVDIGSNNNLVQGNWIGVLLDGTTVAANTNGWLNDTGNGNTYVNNKHD